MKNRMSIRINPWSVVLLVSFIASVCFGLWYLRVAFVQNQYDYKWTTGTHGVWDLTEFDFEGSYLMLRGDVEYVEDELLSPEEFEQSENINTGKPIAINSTSRLTVRFPDDDVYSMAMVSMDYSEKIYINGSLRLEQGNPSVDATKYIAGQAYMEIDVQPIDGVVEIIRQNSNYIEGVSGIPDEIYLGKPAIIGHLTAMGTDMAAMTIGVFFTMFIVHALLFIMLSKYPSNMYFALLCLTWAIRISVENVGVLGMWFPELPWEIFYKLEYITAPVALMLMIFIVRWEFPKIIPKWMVVLTAELFGAYAVFCVVAPTDVLAYTDDGFYAAYIITILTVMFLTVLKLPVMVRNKTMFTEHWVFISGYVIYVIAALVDFFPYYDIVPSRLNFPFADIALLIYSFFCMFAFFRATMRMMDNVRRAEQSSITEADTLRRISASKGEFLGTLSHELKVPIAAISGLAQLTEDMLGDDIPPTAIMKDSMRRIVDESDRMERLVSQLLDTVAIESGNFRMHMGKVNMPGLLEKLEDQYFHVMNKGDNTLKIRIGDDVPLVRGDTERLFQVLINLLSNAVKHTNNGVITLECDADEKFVTTSVTDTGEGISDELLQQIFKRFPEHKHRTGTGLGLYICKKIVEAHDGKIGIMSEAGKGTRVEFILPIKQN